MRRAFSFAPSVIAIDFEVLPVSRNATVEELTDDERFLDDEDAHDLHPQP